MFYEKHNFCICTCKGNSQYNIHSSVQIKLQNEISSVNKLFFQNYKKRLIIIVTHLQPYSVCTLAGINSRKYILSHICIYIHRYTVYTQTNIRPTFENCLEYFPTNNSTPTRKNRVLAKVAVLAPTPHSFN